MSTARWTTTVVGLWIVLSAFLGLGDQGYFWNDVLAGAIGVGSGLALTRDSTWEGWTVAVLGLWMAIASIIPALHAGAGVYWNNILVGAAVAVLGLVPTRGAGRPHPVA
jgi:hypothetical protein